MRRHVLLDSSGVGESQVDHTVYQLLATRHIGTIAFATRLTRCHPEYQEQTNSTHHILLALLAITVNTQPTTHFSCAATQHKAVSGDVCLLSQYGTFAIARSSEISVLR
jgi:hypothetical protein